MCLGLTVEVSVRHDACRGGLTGARLPGTCVLAISTSCSVRIQLLAADCHTQLSLELVPWPPSPTPLTNAERSELMKPHVSAGSLHIFSGLLPIARQTPTIHVCPMMDTLTLCALLTHADNAVMQQ